MSETNTEPQDPEASAASPLSSGQPRSKSPRWPFASVLVTLLALLRPVFTPISAHAQALPREMNADAMEKVFRISGSSSAWRPHPLVSTPQINEGEVAQLADASTQTKDGTVLQWAAEKWERESVAGKAGIMLGAGLVSLPIASRLARKLGGVGGAIGGMLTGKSESIYVTVIQVAVCGAEAEKLEARLRSLSFRRDELADRMRWAIRNDVSVQEARASVGEEEDGMGEGAVARQAARMLLSAKHAGGWVAGRVKNRSFRVEQSAEAQEEFFDQCTRVRATMAGAIRRPLAASEVQDLPPFPAVERLRKENEKLREAAAQVQSLGSPSSPSSSSSSSSSSAPGDASSSSSSSAPGEAGAGVRRDQYLIATVATAVVGTLEEVVGGEASSPAGPATADALIALTRIKAESLLSLEVLWSPHADTLPSQANPAPRPNGGWLSKGEVLASIDISPGRGYSSLERLDLFGDNLC